MPSKLLRPYSEKDITIVFETISTGSIPVRDAKYVPVAQLDRASVYETEGL